MATVPTRATAPAAKAATAAGKAITGLWDDIDGGQDARVYRRALSLAGMLCAGLFLVNCVMAGTVVTLIRHQGDRAPYLVTIHPRQDAVVEIEPLRQRSTGLLRAEEAWVRRYVRYQEEVLNDADVMRSRAARAGGGQRGGFVARRSTPAVYQAFEERHGAFIRDALARGVTRDVVVEDPVEKPAPGVYTVTFTTVDTERGRSIGRSRWRVTLRVAYQGFEGPPGDVQSVENLDEAFGFTVINYDIAAL